MFVLSGIACFSIAERSVFATSGANSLSMLLELALTEILESNEYETISKVSTRVHAHELADRLLRKKKISVTARCSIKHTKI